MNVIKPTGLQTELDEREVGGFHGDLQRGFEPVSVRRVGGHALCHADVGVVLEQDVQNLQVLFPNRWRERERD